MIIIPFFTIFCLILVILLNKELLKQLEINDDDVEHFTIDNLAVCYIINYWFKISMHMLSNIGSIHFNPKGYAK